jgi:hypothetical protein
MAREFLRVGYEIYSLIIHLQHRPPQALLEFHPKCFDEKRPFVSGFLDNFRGWFSSTVARTSFDSNQNRRGPLVIFLQSGCKLETSCNLAANLKLCPGTTRSSVSAVVMSVGGYDVFGFRL